MAGAVIAESIFNFPGMGLLFWQSAITHDFPVMLGGTLVIGVATVLGNLAADVAYGVLDPRIRYGTPETAPADPAGMRPRRRAGRRALSAGSGARGVTAARRRQPAQPAGVRGASGR